MRFGNCKDCFEYTRLRDGKRCKECIRDSNKIVIYELLDDEIIESLKSLTNKYNGYLPMTPDSNYDNLIEEVIDIYDKDKSDKCLFKRSLNVIIYSLKENQRKCGHNCYQSSINKLSKEV